MPRLKISLRGAQISDLALNPDREYIGGRKENCDIRLQAEKGISREHFKIKFEDNRWIISSLSRFGEIYSQGQRVEIFPLEHGLTFQIPPYDFQFSDVPESQIDQARGQSVPQIDENERTVIGATQQVPYIKMLDTKGNVREMLRLEVGNTWTAGRDPSCQIIIPDQRVSRRQFEIRKLNGIYTAIDLGSVNGTFLNGTPISSTDPQALKSGDAISVLDNMMYFELHDPNFQYRMDRIEIPPLQLVQNEENFASNDESDSDVDSEVNMSSDPMMLQNIEQPYTDQMDQQFDPNGGPFTGMPGANQDPNQFYSFQQNSQPVVLTPWQKFTQNKPLVAIAVLLFLAVAYLASEYLNPAIAEKPKSAQNLDATDPFSRLKPEEQKTITDLYSLAQKSMLQQKYSFAKENLDKIHLILPTGYQDSKAILEEAVSSEMTFISQQEQERVEKEKEEQNKKIAETVETCKKLINPEITIDKMKDCLAPVALIDPTNNEYIKLIGEVEKIVNTKKTKAEEELTYQSQVKALEDLFIKAEKVQANGYPYKAIKAYKLVIISVLPDTGNFKDKAKKRISFIEKKIESRTAENFKEADVFLQQGQLKQGILSLRAALVYDPENKIVKEKIDKYTIDLRKQVMVMYQESVIDENFGNIDGSEGRLGAKDKWKKIVELDLDDGEYYRKAFVKLRRYGSF